MGHAEPAVVAVDAAKRAARQSRDKVLHHRQMRLLALLYSDVEKQLTAYESAPSSNEALFELQRERLSSILMHAVGNVPAHRGCATDEEISADPMEALVKFPFLDRATIRDSLADLCEDDLDPSKCYSGVTSGTSGIPVKVIYDQSHMIHLHALAWRRYRRYGVSDHFKMLTPFHTWLGNSWFEYTSALLALSRVAAFGHEPSVAHRTSAQLAQQVEAFSPDVVYGHPSSCLALARLLTEHGAAARPVVVSTYGERLLPAARESLEASFQAPVRDGYGLRETGTVAAQCAAGSYHIESERVWVEVIDSSSQPLPDGDSGELVVTNLINRAQPLLRYRTGDIGELSTEACSCGNSQKVLRVLEGRNSPGVYVRGGGVVDLSLLRRAIWSQPVERFQVVQRSLDEVIVLVLPTTNLTREQAASLVGDLEAACGNLLHVRVQSANAGDFLQQGRRKHVDIVCEL